MKAIKLLFFLISISCVPTVLSAEDVLDIIHRVNRHWQAENPPQVWASWDYAAYHTGNMEAYALTGCADYLRYSTE